MSKIKVIKAKNSVTKTLDKLYIAKIIIATFIISVILTFISDNAFDSVNIIISIIFVLFFVIVGVIFDVIGIASTSADEKPFHAMSSKKIKSATIAADLIRNSEKVSNICNDVVGDISGIISGSAGTAVAIKIASTVDNSILKILIPLIVVSTIATLTIAGKAIGKTIAMNHSNTIIFTAARIMNIFKRKSRAK
ncbi:MAG: hypothetical protein RR306_03505 [Clostridia bacterium]